jgi:hypothetical protein
MAELRGTSGLEGRCGGGAGGWKLVEKVEDDCGDWIGDVAAVEAESGDIGVRKTLKKLDEAVFRGGDDSAPVELDIICVELLIELGEVEVAG